MTTTRTSAPAPAPGDAMWLHFREWGLGQGRPEADLLAAYGIAVVVDHWMIEGHALNLMFVTSKEIRSYLFTLPDARARDEALGGLAVFIDFLRDQRAFRGGDFNPARAFLPESA